MQKERLEERLENFRLECRKNKLRITPQRIAIFKKLLNFHDHPTADEVFQTMKGDFSNISFDTVNRTLLSFAEIGLIDIIKSRGGSRRFDPNTDTHHHLHCVKCGKIIDFHSEVCDNLKIPKDIESQFTILSKRVVLNGICKECSQKLISSDA